jgi:hypothetical protein
MKTKNMVGKNIYSELNKNSRAVWAVVIMAIISVFSAFAFAYNVYNEAGSKLYTVNNKGDLIPLSLVNKRSDKVKVIQSAVSYFITNLYDLDQFNAKERREKTLWLVGEQPTNILKDKDSKGYYSNFITYNGLIQHSEIISGSWNITNIDDSPHVQVEILVNRANGNTVDYYKSTLNLSLLSVNINYPYNPFGYLISNMQESFEKTKAPTEEEEKIKDSLTISDKPNLEIK